MLNLSCLKEQVLKRLALYDLGYTFDLSSLNIPNGYRTSDREGHEFVLNVCGWLDRSGLCVNGTG